MLSVPCQCPGLEGAGGTAVTIQASKEQTPSDAGLTAAWLRLLLSDGIALPLVAELADSGISITRFSLGQTYPMFTWGISSFTEACFIDSQILR